jgi:salicylate hydroxylase
LDSSSYYYIVSKYLEKSTARMPSAVRPQEPLEIAIVGGGIVGLALVVGLLRRGIQVKLYEKASAFRPIGAGIGFTPNSLRALELLHPKAIEAQRKVTTPNGDPKNPNDWLTYLDGYHHNSSDPNDTEEKLLFRLHTGFRGFEGCVRADFLNELLELVPPGVIEFSKGLDKIEDRGDEEKLTLHFQDGTTATADAGITS